MAQNPEETPQEAPREAPQEAPWQGPWVGRWGHNGSWAPWKKGGPFDDNPWIRKTPWVGNHRHDGGWWAGPHLYEEPERDPVESPDAAPEPDPDAPVGPYLLFVGARELPAGPGWDSFTGEFALLAEAQQFAVAWVTGGVGRWCQVVDLGRRKLILRLEGRTY